MVSQYGSAGYCLQRMDKDMRIANTLKNGLYVLMSNLSLALLSVFIRRMFIKHLDIELLGYEGLFGNIFSLLSLADLGVPMIVTYRLYPAFAKKDEQKISELMAVSRGIYLLAGILVLFMSMTLLPFLKYMITGQNLDWNYVYFIYIIQLISTICTYFLAYRRSLFLADQKEYECVRIDTVCSMASSILKIIAIAVFQSYLIYLLTGIISNIASSLFIFFKSNSAYPFLKQEKISFEYVRSIGIIHDAKNNIVQKICLVIYGGTDNIVVSALLGISQVGLFSNYLLISSYVTNFIGKLTGSVQASIGNFINSEDKTRIREQFEMLDLISFLLASFISISYMVLFQPVIKIWLGERYLLSSMFVLFFSINQYIGYNHVFLTLFRNSVGKYEADKPYILAGGVLNIVCSIFLSKYIGIAGIIAGTAIGHMSFWAGRVKVVFGEILCGDITGYIYKQIRNTAVFIAEAVITYWLSSFLGDSVTGIAEKVIVCTAVPNGINLVLFYDTEAGKTARDYAGIILRLYKEKMKERKTKA